MYVQYKKPFKGKELVIIILINCTYRNTDHKINLPFNAGELLITNLIEPTK